MKFKGFSIGDLVTKIPIIQGGMGVGVSLSGLAGAVAAEGGIGVISAAQIGFDDADFFKNPLHANLAALANHIKIAKEKALGGIIGVNIMCVMNNYEEFVKCCVENHADIIISGAGLPVNLPALVENTKTKIAPIISSFRASKILLKLWDSRHKKTADMIIVEGPEAGGHLGFSQDELDNRQKFREELSTIIDSVKPYEEKYEKKIPIIYAGGIHSSQDIADTLALGFDGVQIASRFIATEECDASLAYKKAYLNLEHDDISIVKSPVGMLGRALHNDFVKETENNKVPVKRCTRCISTCNPADTPYCITDALVNAARGNKESGLFFCGDNAVGIEKIVTVKELLNELCSSN